LTIKGSSFKNNTATGNYEGLHLGGAIYIKNGTSNVSGSTLSNNTAINNVNVGYGGALENDGGNLTVTSSIFTKNISVYGGAIDNDGGILQVTGSNFTGNNAIVCIIYSGNTTLTVNKSIFTNNIGTAIDNWGTLNVNSSTFNDNIGGAINNTGNLSVTDSTFTGNTANGGSGGAIDTTNGFQTDNILTTHTTISGSTFTGNKATYGGAIANGGNIVMHFNQIVGNTATYGNAIYNNGGKVNATLNWWGYNLGANIAKQIYNFNGTVTYNPWIVLTTTASPTSVYVGGTSNITAELLYSFNGSKFVYQNPIYGVVPYTGYANFKTTNGTIKNVKFVNGKATSTLTNLTKAEVATVSANVDNPIVSTKVTVKLKPDTK